MRILLASPYPERLEQVFRYGDDAVSSTQFLPLIFEIERWTEADWIVCYGFRHIIQKELLAKCRNVINIHLSVLPHNRGASPNLWSWITSTPKGFSIHRIDFGIDTGPIYHQEFMVLSDKHTLRTSYDRLRYASEAAFTQVWPDIRDGLIQPVAQQGNGSYHSKKQTDEIFNKLPKGWDTPVKDLTPELLK